MVAVLNWVGLIAPVVVVLIRELAALWREHARRATPPSNELSIAGGS